MFWTLFFHYNWTKREGYANQMADFLSWLLHSGMRRGEALGLTRDDVRKVGDLAVVSIRKTKSGKPRFIPRSDAMVGILDRRHKAYSVHSEN